MQVAPAARIGLNIYSPDLVMKSKPTDMSQQSREAAAAEQRVLAGERSLKARVPGGTTHTTYTYATGPDGRRYITGAQISVIAPEDELRAATGGDGGRTVGTKVTARPSTEAASGGGTKANARPSAEASTGGGRTGGTKPTAEAASGADPSSPKARAEQREKQQNDPRVQSQISQLEQIQREVIAHEAAHMAAGGRFAGGASYSYTTGPDGKQYITGGEVPISTPATNDPEEALQNALQVLRAATAPASPSGQDMAVAASAAQAAAQARIELASNAGEDGEPQTVGGDDPEGFDPFRAAAAKGAYEGTRSPFGMWTRTSGFTPEGETPTARRQDEQEGEPEAPFEIAA